MYFLLHFVFLLNPLLQYTREVAKNHVVIKCCIFRPEDYKLADASMEVEENKENVDQKDEDLTSEC